MNTNEPTVRTKRLWLPFGWRVTVVYERSPFVEAFGYKPLAYLVGIPTLLVAALLVLA